MALRTTSAATEFMVGWLLDLCANRTVVDFLHHAQHGAEFLSHHDIVTHAPLILEAGFITDGSGG
jgi:hypothetical protein